MIDPPRLAAGGTGEVEVEEGAALVEQGRVGGVQIFGLAGPEDPGAEGDAPAARVPDREGQPAAEAIVAGFLPSSGGISRPALDQLVIAEALRARP